jgi:hypothetical protein
MPSLGQLLGGIGLKWGAGGIGDFILAILIAFLALGIIAGFIFWIIKRKSWNLVVGFRIPRNDGKLIGYEKGKGLYSAKDGVVWLKRKGMKRIPMKPFDIKRYLGANNYLEVIQIGIEDYRPILPDSYSELIDDQTGEKALMLDVKSDVSSNKAWKTAFEREAKNAFSIKGFLQEYGGIISIGLVIFLWGIQFLVLYNKITR